MIHMIAQNRMVRVWSPCDPYACSLGTYDDLRPTGGDEEGGLRRLRERLGAGSNHGGAPEVASRSVISPHRATEPVRPRS